MDSRKEFMNNATKNVILHLNLRGVRNEQILMC